MCGINCIFDPTQKLPGKADLVRNMNRQMAYRGPDDEGLYHEAAVALGVCRLSIIDAAGGHQPLFNEDQSLVLVCNGEIYNYVELMQVLKGRGHQFQSGSDAETILHLYEEKGVECLEDLRGMFAFVLWDSKRQHLFAARDWIGIKPLYISNSGGTLWLSSELKAIFGAAGISPTLRPETVYQFLQFGYAIDQRHTVLKEIDRVLPGEYLIADASGVVLRRYRQLRFGGNQGVVDRTDQEILNILEEAVQLRLRSDVPVAILLSGGVDSSTIAAIAAHSSQKYTTICAGYRGNYECDERPQARETASFLGLPLKEVILDDRIFAEHFNQLSRYVDEPIGDVAAMAQWAIYSWGRQNGYKVMLSGIGGDEVFFGYDKWNILGEESRTLAPESFDKWIGFDQEEWQLRVGKFLGQISGPALLDAAPLAYDPLYSLRNQAPPGPDAMAAMLFGSYLIHNGCLQGDKLGMGNSVEVRMPFLDHVLVQAVYDLPLARRFGREVSKIMLKRVAKGLVPDTVLNAVKRGFTPPRQFVEGLVRLRLDQIRDGILARTGWLDRGKLLSVCSQTAAMPWLWPNRIRNLLGIPNETSPLFHILAFESWYSVLTNLPTLPKGYGN
jgi:asparagine synthase (glutamine-hydrolysing)